MTERIRSGRHFLHIPGPTNVPDRVLRAMDRPTIDHRGPEFASLGLQVLESLKEIFRCSGPVVIYPSSGSGAWEAALVNTLSPGDRLLMYETGHFAVLWRDMAQRLGLQVDWISADWRHGINAARIESRLAEDIENQIKAVAIVHNETSTGTTSSIAAVRRAIDQAGHPALLMVDTISSLGSIDYRHDEWGVDVAICGSQKGLMLPPGLGFNALSDKAVSASRHARLPRSYWDWEAMLKPNTQGFFPYTPATNLLFGLREAICMILEEGLEHVFARHSRLAEATRLAIEAWGLEIFCADPEQYSNTTTAVLLPDGHNADRLRKIILDRYDLSLGAGLGNVRGRIFRIGHLGDCNELMLTGALSGVEMGLGLAGVPHKKGGVQAALEFLSSE